MNPTDFASIRKSDAEEMAMVDPSCLSDPTDRTHRAELYVLGSMMRDPDLTDEGLRLLKSSDFYHATHQVIFQSIQRIIEEKRTPAATAVFDDIKKSGKAHFFKNDSPVESLASAITFCIAGNDFSYYVAQVKDHAMKRALYSTINEMARDLTLKANNGEIEEWSGQPARELASEYSVKLSKICEDGSTNDLISILQSSSNVMRQIDEDQKSRDPSEVIRGVRTGISGIDAIIPSFEPGELVIIAARPGVGKSALATMIARNVAMEGGKVLFFSLEMPHEQQTRRILSMSSNVSLQTIRGHQKMSDDEADRLFRVSNEVSRLPIMYCDKRGMTSTQVAIEIRSAKRKYGDLSLVVVDYLQLLRAENPRDTRTLQIGYATKMLRNVAGEVGCPIVCLAQLNREAEKHGGSGTSKPRLIDLRDSGEIEQDADIVCFLHVEPETAHLPVQNVNYIIAKQRNGETKEVPLQFARAFTKFADAPVMM